MESELAGAGDTPQLLFGADKRTDDFPVSIRVSVKSAD